MTLSACFMIPSSMSCAGSCAGFLPGGVPNNPKHANGFERAVFLHRPLFDNEFNYGGLRERASAILLVLYRVAAAGVLQNPVTQESTCRTRSTRTPSNPLPASSGRLGTCERRHPG